MIQKIRHEGSIIRQILTHPQGNRFTRKQTVPTYMLHKHGQGPKVRDNPIHSHPSWIWESRWSGLQDMYFRSSDSCRSQLERVLPYRSGKFFNQFNTPHCQRLVSWVSQKAFVSGFTIWENDIILSLFILWQRAHLAKVPSWSATFPNNRFHLRRRAISSVEWNIWKVFWKIEKLVISSQNIVDSILSSSKSSIVGYKRKTWNQLHKLEKIKKVFFWFWLHTQHCLESTPGSVFKDHFWQRLEL